MGVTTKLNVNECEYWSKKIKNWFGKSKDGEVVLYKNEDGINLCDYMEHEKITYESKYFNFLYSIDGLDNSRKDAKSISYEIYERTHRAITFAEASEKWGLNDSTLRKLVTTDKLREGRDYWKSGKTWIITVGAMEKIYGEPKSK